MRPVFLLHLYYPDLAIELIDRVGQLGSDIDVVATVTEPLLPEVRAALDRLPNRVEIVEVPNGGWDIGPLFAVLPRLSAAGYDLICKLHTKKGESGYSAEWRELFFESLIASDDQVRTIVDAFEHQPRLSLVGPEALYMSAAQHEFLNGGRLARIVPALTAPRLPPSDWGFFAGTMFWARLEALERLAPLVESGAESGARDGAIAHAIERLIGLVPVAKGTIIGLVDPDADEPLRLIEAPGTPASDPIIQTLVAEAEKSAGTITPELAAAIDHRNPLVDFLEHGLDADALNPNPYFNSDWYNRVNSDVFAAGIHPLAHYIKHGAFEDRSTGPLFDMGFYMARNPEIARDRLDPLRHFLEFGLPAGQSAIPVGLTTSEQDGPERFYRQFNLTREKSFIDRLAALPEKVRAEAAATRFSIIMPCWNREGTVGAAIQSVLDQTHGAWELFVIDDGSSDGSRAAVKPYLADPRIRLIKSAHAGVSAARNQGLDAATGDIVAYLDSDNRWKPSFLEGMALFLAAEALEAGYAALALRDDRGHLSGYHGADFDWEECLQQNYVDLNTFVHARALVAELGGFDIKLRRMVDWDFILRYGRDRRVGYAPFVGCDYADGEGDGARITVAEPLAFAKIVRAKHRGAADAPITLTFAIKIAAPEAEKTAWGDYHFAEALARSIERLGHIAHIDFRDHWQVRPPADEDAVIVLRGLIGAEPRPGQINMLWSISHPDQLSIDEIEGYTRVYVASRSTAEWLSHITDKPVEVLLQATDTNRFKPPVKKLQLGPDVLFCGNSRGVERPIVDWAIESGYPPEIIGGGWEGTAAAALVTAATIDNADLPSLYAGAGAVLNDHWPSMRAFGYVSNRLFDVVAAGGRAVSDAVPSIASIFGQAVREVEDAEGAGAAIEAALANRSVDRKATEMVRAHQSFDARAAKLVGDAQALLGLSRSAAEPEAEPSARLRVHAIVPYGPHGPQSSAYIRLAGPLTDESVNGDISFSMGPPSSSLPPCDVVIVQRAALASITEANALILAIGQLGATLIVDVDDAFVLIGDDHPEAAFYGPRNAALNRIIAASAETWFSTPALRAAYSGIAQRTAIIPNQLDPRLWRDWRAAARPILNDPVVRFLYMGTATHSDDFALVRPAFDRLAETYGGRFDLTVIGVAPEIAPAPWLTRLSPPSDAIAYPRFVRWLRKQGPFDVGIAPLQDTSFNRCKSDVKLLDYTALGLLAMASDGPAYAADAHLAEQVIRVGDENWHPSLADLIDRREVWSGLALVAKRYLWADRTAGKAAKQMLRRIEPLVRS